MFQGVCALLAVLLQLMYTSLKALPHDSVCAGMSISGTISTPFAFPYATSSINSALLYIFSDENDPFFARLDNANNSSTPPLGELMETFTSSSNTGKDCESVRCKCSVLSLLLCIASMHRFSSFMG